MDDPSRAGDADAAAQRGRRWFSYQPNVTGAGIIASYSRRFWILAVVLGIVAGVAAAALKALLNLAQRVGYGAAGHTFLQAARAAPAWRHFAALIAGGVIVIVGLRLLGRLPASGGTEVSEALWLRQGRLPFRASIARGVLSIVTVGLGVSLGREGAPQLAGAATASKLSDWAKLPLWQRRLLVASGAGAGFAAVYNVPLGGTLFALEVLLGTVALSLVLPALVICVTATAIAWITLGTGPTYEIPHYAVHASQIVWAVIVGPLIGLLGVAWAQLIAWATQVRPRRAGRYVAPVVVFSALAALSLPYPQLLGNGQDAVQLAVLGSVSIGVLAVLFALKPLVTAACLGSGSPGGLFTPTFAVGVLFAGVLGIAWTHIWHGAPAGSYTVIGGAAFLAAAMQAPLAGTVLVLELTRHFDALMVPTLIAVAEATIISRKLGAHSIYSARLRSDPGAELSPTAGAVAIATLHALDDALPAALAEQPAPE
jgi:CIC family chloride channel protein